MTRTRLPGVLLVLPTVLGLIWAFTGGPLLLLWCGAGLAVGVALLRWMPAALALAATVAALLVLELLLLRGSAAVGDRSLPLELVVWSVIGVAAGTSVVLRPMRPVSRDRWMLALSAAVGPTVAAILAVLVALLPNALHLAWAMNHDSVRDLVASRLMYENGGISERVSQPTPLPFGIVSSNLAPGRAAATDLLRFDVTRLAEVWALVIVVTCLLFSAIAAQVFRRSRPFVTITLVVISGLGGLSWWVSGIQFAGGFLNAGFAIVLLLAGWLAFLSSRQRPIASTVVLLLAGVAMLAVWSPLVVCLLGLSAVSFGRALLAGRRRRTLVSVLAAAALIAVYASVVTIPALLSSSGDLASDGYFPDLLSPLVAAVALVFAIIAVIDGFRVGWRYEAIGALALVATVVLGCAYLLYLRRNSPDAWGYYPEKFAWLGSILLMVAAVSLIASSLQDRPPLTRRQLIPVGAMVLAVIVVGTVVRGPSGIVHDIPAVGLLAGKVDGITNAQTEAVFAHSGTGDPWVQYYLVGLRPR